MAAAVGFGLTRTVAVVGVPGHPLKVGVIVNVTVIGEAVVFVSVPVIDVPLPFAAIPVTVAVLSLVHANVTDPVVLVKDIVDIAIPEHLIWLAGFAVAAAVGLTVCVTFCVFVQPAGVVKVIA